MSVISLNEYKKSLGLPEFFGTVNEQVVHANAFERALANYNSRFDGKLPNVYKKYLKSGKLETNATYGFQDPHNCAYKTIVYDKSPMPFALRVDATTKHLGKGMQSGNVVDSFAWLDRKYGITLDFLKGKHEGSKLTLETRSDLIACEEYVNELVRIGQGVKVIIWLCPVQDNELRELEPGAPSNKRRLVAFDKLKECGVNVITKSVPKAIINGYLKQKRNA